MTGDEDDAALEAVIRELGATGLVVKPGRDGSSIGVSKLDRPTTASLREALKLAKSLCDEILVVCGMEPLNAVETASTIRKKLRLKLPMK